MKILMVASEAAPFAKTGGLADVLGALPAALAQLGDDVAVVLPKYDVVEAPAARRVWDHLPVTVGHTLLTAAIDEVVHQQVRYFLVDQPQLFHRGGIYGDAHGAFPDNHVRFGALTQAALGIGRHLFRPQVFHGHDWQAGLLAPLLKCAFVNDPAFFGARLVFTIHNLGYQGNFPPGVLRELGMEDPALYHPEGLEFHGQVSFLKAGIVWSDAVNTVSPTYAREIQTPEYGFGLDGVLRSCAAKLTGILNGVDYSIWSPEVDPHLPAHYSAADLSGKLACKRALLAEMRLPPNHERPLLGIISRFAHQKGLDLVLELGPWLAAQDAALVVLGSGEAQLEAGFASLARAFPEKIAVRLGYDEALSHRVEAGADIFLMPSRYEPCGLNQIYSLRYGTVPVVRATGGLADTVDPSTGFLFQEFSASAFQAAIAQALAAFPQRGAWRERQLRGMAKDYSWATSARLYRELYQAHHTTTDSTESS
jgi:starch synthase